MKHWSEETNWERLGDAVQRLKRLGYRFAIVRSIEDTRAALAAWGIPTRETDPQGEVIP